MAKAAKTTKTKEKPKAKEKPAENMLTLKDLEKDVGIQQASIRDVLRKEGIEKNGGRYQWEKGSKEYTEIVDLFAERAKRRPEAKEKKAPAKKKTTSKKKAA